MKCSKSGAGIFLLVMLLASIALIPAASAQENATKKDLSFGPETLDELKKNTNFIAAYGSIPALETSEERQQWLDTLGKIMEEINANFDHEMSKYSYPNGPVTGCGVTIDGVLKVGINKSEKVEKPFMDEIYKIFDSKASQMGLKEVPVVFVYEDNPVPNVATETSNLSISKEKNTGRLNDSNDDSEPNNGNISNVNSSSENNSSKNNSTPGFSLLGGLICLYGGWKFSKK